MARNTSHDKLRHDVMALIGPGIVQLNALVHQQVRDLVLAINENYLHRRNAALGSSPERYPIGLFICYESRRETHTGLESGYIRWRYGRFSINKSRSATGKQPITRRVRKGSRLQIHYMPNDFSAVPLWNRAPTWEHRLVMYTEKKVRPLREALHVYKEAQRLFLHAPVIPAIDPGFDDFTP